MEFTTLHMEIAAAMRKMYEPAGMSMTAWINPLSFVTSSQLSAGRGEQDSTHAVLRGVCLHLDQALDQASACTHVKRCEPIG